MDITERAIELLVNIGEIKLRSVDGNGCSTLYNYNCVAEKILYFLNDVGWVVEGNKIKRKGEFSEIKKSDS